MATVEGAQAALRFAVEEARLPGAAVRAVIAGLLLGSVSHQCAHHAPCPVTIVR